MRAFFIMNIALWFVLFVAWLMYGAMQGWADPASIQVRIILAVTACLLTVQGLVRYRRAKRLIPS